MTGSLLVVGRPRRRIATNYLRDTNSFDELQHVIPSQVEDSGNISAAVVDVAKAVSIGIRRYRSQIGKARRASSVAAEADHVLRIGKRTHQGEMSIRSVDGYESAGERVRTRRAKEGRSSPRDRCRLLQWILIIGFRRWRYGEAAGESRPSAGPKKEYPGPCAAAREGERCLRASAGIGAGGSDRKTVAGSIWERAELN